MAQWLEPSGANAPDPVRRHVVGVVDLARAEGVSADLFAAARAERHQNGQPDAETRVRAGMNQWDGPGPGDHDLPRTAG